LVTQEDLLPDEAPPLQAVIMAGGYGTRLRPLTRKLPKPMLPVGERPILELIIRQLRKAGIRNVNISTHYKSKKITEHFGDGKAFGIQLRYLTENRPLGTAGALGLMKPPKEPILVVNGDILTRVDFRSMLDFHREHKADMTVGIQKYDIQSAYGVVETEGSLIRGLAEKPHFSYLINAGIYLLEPSVIRLIPKGRHFDMTDLIQKLLDTGRPIVSFPIREYWLDIGQHEDYQRAQKDFADDSTF
jgi:NDP-sugar pyrophosphorylase family protein